MLMGLNRVTSLSIRQYLFKFNNIDLEYRQYYSNSFTFTSLFGIIMAYVYLFHFVVEIFNDLL